jgi:DNA primase
MSQIADDLKQQVDIMDVIWRYVDLKRAWSNYTGLCPFHREKSPSFMVSRDRQTYKCFWCWLGGDVISFVMEYEKMDFWDAIKELATRYHFDLTPYKSEKSSIDSYIDTKDQREKLKLINKLTSKWFHEQLAKHPEASDYTHDRRHLDDDIIARRQIGYAPSNWQLLNQYLQSKWFTVTDLTEAWLIRQSQSNADTYSFFRHRMMFPISDHVGNIVWFGGRIINPEDNPKYLNTGDTELYRKSNILYGLHQAKSHIKTHDQVIVVEWYMDVIALDRLWMPVGVAPCGTSLTVDHVKLLTRYTQNIVLMFDNDNAWQTAGIRSVKLLLEQGIYPKLLRLSSPYKDIDDLANSDLGDDEKQTILTSTVDWFDALVAQLQIAYPLDHPVAMKQLINEMFTVLTSIGDFSVFMWYLNKLAKLVNIDENGLLNQYKQRHRSNKSVTRRPSETPPNYEEDVDLLLVSIAQLPIYNMHPPWESTLMSIKGDQGGIFVQLHKLALDLQALKWNPKYTQSQLEEWVLRRSRTIDQMTNDKQLTELQQFISRYIQANTQLIIKSSSLTLDEKQAYLTRIKHIK